MRTEVLVKEAQRQAEMQNAAANLEIIAKGLAEFFKDDPKKISYWLLTENSHFGNISPANLIMLRGKAGIAKVARFVESATHS